MIRVAAVQPLHGDTDDTDDTNDRDDMAAARRGSSPETDSSARRTSSPETDYRGCEHRHRRSAQRPGEVTICHRT